MKQCGNSTMKFMVDELHSNLEPLEEGDLDLKDKFLGESTPEKKGSSEMEGDASRMETPIVPEQNTERKEGSVEKDATYSKILSQAPQPVVLSSEEDVAADATHVDKEKDLESKISKLIGLAETKGIPHAVKVARHYQDNYLLDELHDRLLAEELHDALVKKGMIKEQ